MRQRLEMRVRRSNYSDHIEFVVFQDRPEGRFAVAAPVVMTEYDAGAYIEQPTLKLRTEEAQTLMDELWLCGLRPTEGTGSAGSLAATERHLADMRKIAFGFLDAKPNEGK